MSLKGTLFAVLVISVATLGTTEVQAQRAAAPPPPAPPAAGGADKPTGDALAQEAEAKPPETKDEKDKKHSPWSGKLAAGFNFTSGNSNTKSFNVAMAAKYDPQTKNVFKGDAFYLRNVEDGASTVDRTTAHLRDEYSLGARWFAFGDGQFLKDRFKGIDSLISTTAGAGIRLIKTSDRELTADLGAGAVFEKDQGQDRTSSGALRAGESYSGKISKSAGFTQNAFAIWKTSDFADAYYHFDAGIGAEVSERLELKVALIDEYKRKPPEPTIKRNDVAGIVQLEFKF